MCAPYMWYQKDKHFPPPALLPGTFALTSFAASFGLLGKDVSINMYHPLAKSMQKNMSELLILPGGGGATIIQQWTMELSKEGRRSSPSRLPLRAKFHREREVWVRDNVVRKAAGVLTIKQIIDLKTLYNMKIETCI